jgi:hypothetical protein
VSTPASTGLRGTRAAVFGTATLLLALGAHALAGGALPGPFVLLAAGLPTACVAVVLARRVRGPVALTATLTLTQLVLHELLATTATATGCMSAMPAGPHAMHADPGITCGATPGMSGMSGMGHGLGASAAMITAHALALLATAALLTWGERLAVRLWTWAVPATKPFAAPAPVEPVSTRPRTEAARSTSSVFVENAVPRRGPPSRGLVPSRTFA